MRGFRVRFLYLYGKLRTWTNTFVIPAQFGNKLRCHVIQHKYTHFNCLLVVETFTTCFVQSLVKKLSQQVYRADHKNEWSF